VTKAEFVSQIAEKSDHTKKTTEAVLKSLIGAIYQALKDEGEIRIGGLGTFKVTERKERAGVNPQTGAKMTIPASKAPTFRAAKALKEAVKEQEKKSEKKKK
jgi:DNA-binding protein HU-beta